VLLVDQGGETPRGNNTVDEMYRGPIAERAKVQAARIAWAMHRRLTGTNTRELDTLVAR
jgi:hemoglobin